MYSESQSSKIRCVISEQKNQIFKWLYNLTQQQIKDVLTIRNKAHLKIIHNIIFRVENNNVLSPNQIVKCGFAYIKEQDKIVLRSSYKFKIYKGADKGKNKMLHQLADNLYMNLSISRSPSQEVSIKRSFIKDIQNCMQEISNNSLFNLTSLGDQIEKSFWFQMGTFYSVAEWIVYLFQCQIKMAYVVNKKNKKDKKQRVKNIYEFLKQRYPLENIKSIVQKRIVDKFIKDDIGSQNYKSNKNFLITKCMDRIKDEYNGHEYLVEYSWYYENLTNDNYKILNETCKYFTSQYEEWVENRALESICQKEQKDKENKINKRKRKKQKLKSKAIQKQKQKLQQNGQKINKNSQTEQQVNKIQSKHQKKVQIKFQQKSQVQVDSEQLLSEDKFFQKQQEEQTTHTVEKEQTNYKSDKAKERLVNKKIIKQRINQYYQCFASQLTQTAISFDKYRKITWNVIRSFIQTLIIPVNQQKMEEQNAQTQWKLQIYGSASAGFSLQHSDLDLVLLTNNTNITLNDIYYKLKVQEWSIDCKLIQAHVPIVTLKVNLSSAPFVKKQLSSKQFKKIEGQLFSVDLTLASIYEPHSGIQNTKQLKHIFQTYPIIRNICTLLKEYLRVRKLNKPYTGGIGSYVLIIMVHAILTRKNVLGKHEQKADEYRMIKQISNYLQNEFKPFETVISCQKNSKIQADSTIHLNIMSPQKEQLLKTSAFHIIKIINQFRKLREFQDQVEKELQGMNINEKRNMKNYFIKAFNEFLYEKQV